MTTTQTQWNKVASVTRRGKYFYTATINGKLHRVTQSWITHLWEFNDGNGDLQGGFKTARQAMKAAQATVN